jgi:hypothetical protein
MAGAIRELLAAAPRLLGLWLLIVVPGTFAIAWLTNGQRLGEAAALAAATAVAGVPFVGFLWLDPTSGWAGFTWRRFGAALIVSAVTGPPAIVIGTWLADVVSRALP